MSENKEKDPRPRGYRRQPFCAAMLGRRGIGKTTSLVSMLIDLYRKRFDIIIVMTKTLHLQKPVWERVYGRGFLIVPKGIDMNVLKSLKDFMETQNEEKEALIIIDDVGLQARIAADKKQWKDKATKAELEDELTNIATAGRHHGISTIYLAQAWTMLPTMYRKQLDWIGVLQATSPEQEMMYREVTADVFGRDIDSYRIYHRLHTGQVTDVNGKLKEIKMYFVYNEGGQFKIWPATPLSFQKSDERVH